MKTVIETIFICVIIKVKKVSETKLNKKSMNEPRTEIFSSSAEHKCSEAQTYCPKQKKPFTIQMHEQCLT